MVLFEDDGSIISSGVSVSVCIFTQFQDLINHQSGHMENSSSLSSANSAVFNMNVLPENHPYNE
jgi:hypothetical protein